MSSSHWHSSPCIRLRLSFVSWADSLPRRTLFGSHLHFRSPALKPPSSTSVSHGITYSPKSLCDILLLRSDGDTTSSYALPHHAVQSHALAYRHHSARLRPLRRRAWRAEAAPWQRGRVVGHSSRAISEFGFWESNEITLAMICVTSGLSREPSASLSHAPLVSKSRGFLCSVFALATG